MEMGFEFIGYLVPVGLAIWLTAGFSAWSQEYARRLYAGSAADRVTLWAAAYLAYQHRTYWWVDYLVSGLAGGMVLWLLVDQSWSGLAFIALLLGLVALAWLDLHSGLLPDALTLPLLGLGWCLGPLGLVPAMTASLLIWGGMAGVAWGYGCLRGQAGFGGGDVKYLAMLAAWLGGSATLSVLWLACLLGLLWWAGGWAGRRSSYAFGPWMTLAALPWVLAGPTRGNWALGAVLGVF